MGQNSNDTLFIFIIDCHCYMCMGGARNVKLPSVYSLQCRGNGQDTGAGGSIFWCGPYVDPIHMLHASKIYSGVQRQTPWSGGQRG